MADETVLTLEDRLDRAEARAAIADLVHDYARFVRRDMPESVADLFTPDGWFEIREGFPDRPDYSVRSRLENPEQLHSFMIRSKGAPHPIPLIHNLMIKVDGDSATANSVMEGQIFGTGQAIFGEYRDTFSRMDGRWLFASRCFTIFDPAPSA